MGIQILYLSLHKQLKKTIDMTKTISTLSVTKIKKHLGISYLGSVAHSAKLMHSMTHKKIATYGVYLAPADVSGYNVCKNSAACKDHCLFTSGLAKIDVLSNKNNIISSRIKKTKLLYEDKYTFMKLLISEIAKNKAKAVENGYEFSVRVNCTSDVNVNDLNFEGKNICEIFPNVIFYDYTKVYTHLDNTKKYQNYDITYSFNGHNWTLAKKALDNGYRVAVVFENELPKTFNGYRVINGDLYDARYYDEKNVIVGLKYKVTAKDVKNHKQTIPETPFVVKQNDIRCGW